MCDLGAVTSGPQSAVQRVVILLESGPFWVMSVLATQDLHKMNIIWKNRFQ